MKYDVDILNENVMLHFRPSDTLKDSNFKLLPGQGESLQDLGRCWSLIWKLNYLYNDKDDMMFDVSVVSQSLNAPYENYWNSLTHILVKSYYS